MSKRDAQQEAVRLAVAKLQEVNWEERCRLLELPVPQDGLVRLRMFGMDVDVRQDGAEVLKVPSGESVKLGDRILMLHYLLCEKPIHPTGELISFRGLAEGQFYWQPFRSRTVIPLLGRIGNDLNLLKTHLTQRFDWEEIKMGDFGARVHALGKFDLTLGYHLGDEEFPPEADVLFDPCITEVFVAEDVAVLASRICLGLL